MSKNLVLFDGIDANGKASLWETDGTPAGTFEISVAGAAFFNSVPAGPQFITAFGNRVLFEGRDSSNFDSLWVTDGTSPGTTELPVPGVDWEFGLQPTWLTVFGSEVLFDGTETNHRSGLWVTNGTVAGTSEISVAGSDPNGLRPSHFTPFGSEVLFLGSGAGSGPSPANSGLWVTDGTSAGTSELSVVGAYSGGLFGLSPPQPNFAALGNKVLFEGDDAHAQSGLWVTNGTSAGTSEISIPGPSLRPAFLTTFGSEVLFNGVGQFNGSALWVTDGTSAGTSEISVAGTPVSGLNPDGFAVFGTEVLFAGSDASGKRGLWVTDGTSAGTSEIPVAAAGPQGLFVNPGGVGPNFVVFGSEVLFEGHDASGHNGLWVTNGTSAGTSEIPVAGAGSNGVNPGNLAVLSRSLLRPVLSNVPTTDVFAARGPAVTLAPSLQPNDDNSTTLSSTTVAITGGGFAGDGDVLAATTTGTSIAASYDSSAETLTLTGTDTLANYQLVLESITFGTASQNPTDFLSNPTRTVTWAVDDGTTSSTIQTTVNITHPPPALSNVSLSDSFTEEAAAITLSPGLVVTEPDSLTLASATAWITGGLSGRDVLAASTAGTGITASYNSFTSVLTLTGVDTLAHYQTVLDSITFSSGDNPTNYGFNPSRAVTWVLNDGVESNNLNTMTTVSLTVVNDPPTLSNLITTPAVAPNGGATLLPFVEAEDPDDLTLAGATVAVSGGTFAGDGDVLAANTTGTSITASYNSATETLTFSGTDTLLHYSAVLRSVTFSPGANPTNHGSNPTRMFTWTLDDGSASNNLSAPTTTTISIGQFARNDFTADGKSDLLFQNTNGTPQIWLMNGTSVASQTTLAAVPPSWHIVGTGDVNSDGKADIIWQNTDGTPAVWEMNGTSLITAAALPAVPPSWHIIATGDFNDDGKADLLWQNTDGTPAIWVMNGTSLVSAIALPAVPPSWRVIGAGDFSGDGQADILWQNSDGTPAIWEMNGTSLASAVALTAVPPEWKIVGTGDFNGDGKSDILWVDTKTNTAAIWEMNGTSIMSAATLPAVPSSWSLIGTSDFNGDGTADIIWQNSDGTPGIWEMNGTSFGWAVALASPGAGWQIKNDGPIPPDQMGTGAGGSTHLSAPDAANGNVALGPLALQGDAGVLRQTPGTDGIGVASLAPLFGETTVANALHLAFGGR
jgi:ELWxxDGT repeat protein